MPSSASLPASGCASRGGDGAPPGSSPARRALRRASARRLVRPCRTPAPRSASRSRGPDTRRSRRAATRCGRRPRWRSLRARRRGSVIERNRAVRPMSSQRSRGIVHWFCQTIRSDVSLPLPVRRVTRLDAAQLDPKFLRHGHLASTRIAPCSRPPSAIGTRLERESRI